MAEGERRAPGDGWVPVPDPTLLTTAQLIREIEALAAQLDRRLRDLEKLFEAKLQASTSASQARYDQIMSLFAEREMRTKAISDHITSAREEVVKNAKEAIEARNMVLSHEEKFKSVQTQFRDNKTAVDAALTAAKDSVDKQNIANATATAKSEAAFTKQIDQLGSLTQQATKAAEDKINDLKERIQAMEGVRKGGGEVIAWVIGAGGVLVAVVTVIVMIMRHV